MNEIKMNKKTEKQILFLVLAAIKGIACFLKRRIRKGNN